jgi:two-component system chemotaxis response regulator CheY
MPNDLTRLSVLIVDPDSTMAALTRDVVNSLGIRSVVTARDGARALGELRAASFDIVIVERDMAPVNGIALTKQIRTGAGSPDPHVAILMVTAIPTLQMVTAARDAGVTEFLIKPFSVKDLHKRISAILNHPRHFIEVSDYFGPDRRRRAGPYYGEEHRRRGETGGGEGEG